MKVSTKGRYGLRAILDIGTYSATDFVSIKNISEREEISENYLEQLMMPLKKAKLVKSNRGMKGGYQLGRDAADISVGDVLRALEGDLYPVNCAERLEKEGCLVADNCVTKNVWARLYQAINEVVDNITLADLIQEKREQEQ